MTDNETHHQKKLSLSQPGKLELKKTVEGAVRQSFSHGRSKVVTVEVKKKRTFEAGTDGMKEVKGAPDPVFADVPEEAVEPPPPTPAAPVDQGPTLTDHERAARAKALEDAKKAEEERLIRAEEDRENEALRAKEAAEHESRRKLEEEVRARREAEARRRAEEEEALAREQRGRAAAEAGVAKLKAHDLDIPSEEEQKSKRSKMAPKRPTSARKDEPRRRAGKLTIADALDETERVRSLAPSAGRAKQKKKEGPVEHGVRDVVLPETITVQGLTDVERSVSNKVTDENGRDSNYHQSIDADTAELVAQEFGHKVKQVVMPMLRSV